MDRHFGDQGLNSSGLKTRPSELFKRNCWISFEPVEGSLSVLADYIGPHKIMWATDYPRSDGFFLGTPQMIGKQLEPSSPEARHQVLAGGATGFTGCISSNLPEVAKRKRLRKTPFAGKYRFAVAGISLDREVAYHSDNVRVSRASPPR
jgi:hypothetical protein